MQSFLLFMASALLSISTFTSNDNDKILGHWINEDNSRVLEFVKNGSEYEAIVRKAELPDHIGKKQITSLKYDKKNAYMDGTLHIFQKNRTANCSAKLLSEDELKLKVSMGLMSKSATWTRVDAKKADQ